MYNSNIDDKPDDVLCLKITKPAGILSQLTLFFFNFEPFPKKNNNFKQGIL